MSTHRIDHVVARVTLGRGQFVEEANEISDEASSAMSSTRLAWLRPPAAWRQRPCRQRIVE